MPVARGTEVRLTRSLVFAVGSLALGFGLVFLVISLAGSGGIEANLGDDVFLAGPATNRAEEIGEDGPILFGSLSGDRPIFLQHLGDEPGDGWFAIDARSPSDRERCAITWDAANERFLDPCASSSAYPADGTGLTRYEVVVRDDGVLVIDFRQVLDADGNPP